MDSDWRKEALAKFFNASFVHVDSEGERMTLRDDVGRAMYSSFGSIYRDLYDEESGEYSYDEFIADGGWITNEDTYSVDADHFTRMRDAAIAAFEAALLSDEVVEAAARVAVYCEGDDWGRMVSDSPTVADAHIEVARRQLQAALAAAKGTEGSA